MTVLKRTKLLLDLSGCELVLQFAGLLGFQFVVWSIMIQNGGYELDMVNGFITGQAKLKRAAGRILDCRVPLQI